MYGEGILRGLGVTLRNLVRRPFTIQYPEARIPQHPRFRGQEFTWYEQRCTGCASCAKYCPLGIIRIVTDPDGGNEQDGGSYKVDVFDIDQARCMYCGLCVEACPYDALHMGSGFEAARYRRADLVIDIDTLKEREKHPSTWFRPQLEREKSDPHHDAPQEWESVGREPFPLASQTSRTDAGRDGPPVQRLWRLRRRALAVAFDNLFSEIVFWALAVVTIGSAALVVHLRSIFRAALMLVVSFLGIAGIFAMVNAEFLAVVQVLVYGGGIAVLVIFAVMMTRDVDTGNRSTAVQPRGADDGHRTARSARIQHRAGGVDAAAGLAAGTDRYGVRGDTDTAGATAAERLRAGVRGSGRAAAGGGHRSAFARTGAGTMLERLLIISAILFCIGLYGGVVAQAHDRGAHVRRAHVQRGKRGARGVLALHPFRRLCGSLEQARTWSVSCWRGRRWQCSSSSSRRRRSRWGSRSSSRWPGDATRSISQT